MVQWIDRAGEGDEVESLLVNGDTPAAVRRQAERDGLAALVAAAKADHRPVTDEETEAKRDALRRARRERGTVDPSAA